LVLALLELASEEALMPEDRDDLDRTDAADDTELDAEDEVGAGDEEDDEFEELDEEEDSDEKMRGVGQTDEVGSEGGSPGDSMGTRRFDAGGANGTEASETWQEDGADREFLDQTDDRGVPVRRSPN
jgi:hypothetical protein